MLAASGSRPSLASEDGGVLVMVTIWLPIIILFITLVVDVGNWFEHKRHLQSQADAAALAAAGDFRIPCIDQPIIDRANQYAGFTSPSGTTYNPQVAGGQSRTHIVMNSATYYNQSSPVDSTVRTGAPCGAGMIDVKLTEADLPWYFGFGKVVQFINAHARVEIKPLVSAKGALPIGVPDVNPTAASVSLVDESTGQTLQLCGGACTKPLVQNGTAGGLMLWDNTAAPFSNVVMPNVPVGVRVNLSGSTSTICGDPLVVCYDLGSTGGLSFVRTWTGVGIAPVVRNAFLTTGVSGACSNGYFNGGGCNIGLTADVDVGVNGTAGLQVTAALSTASNATQYAMTLSGACVPAALNCSRWASTAGVPIPAGTGPVPIYLHWQKTSGLWNGLSCKNGGSNPCKGDIVVHRSFSYLGSRSGPIQAVQVSEAGVGGANSFQVGTTHTLTVQIGILGSLQYASSVNDPIVSLRVVGNQNQSLDCDPGYSNLRDELANGCRPQYTKNSGVACPNQTTLWASAQPWPCVAIDTGHATNQVSEGMNLRILGASKPNTCTQPNHWSQFPNLPIGDPRIVAVFLTPFGSFDGTGGNTTVPTTNFAFFYVTGWTGQGSGFNNPCQGNGDDPVPNNDPAVIVGHFIKYVQTINTGGGGPGFCNLSQGSLNTGACVAVLTQ
jgi:Flp pilus assembly protein TadG